MNGSRRRYLAMRKRQRQGQLGKGYFRPLSPNETHLLQRDKWYFNWEKLLTTPSTLHIYGLFANNHRLLSLMAVDLEPGVATLEYAERAGYVEKRTSMYRTLPHMIGYACELNFQVFGDDLLVIAPKTTELVREMYEKVLDTTFPYVPQLAIDRNFTYLWTEQWIENDGSASWHEDRKREVIHVYKYCAQAMRDLYYKQEGS